MIVKIQGSPKQLEYVNTQLNMRLEFIKNNIDRLKILIDRSLKQHSQAMNELGELESEKQELIVMISSLKDNIDNNKA